MKLRRTMLFVPGNNAGMVQNAHVYGSDSVMFDLEDSITMEEKDSARMLVYSALTTIDYGNCEKVVRVNPLSTPYGKEDIRAMVLGGIDIIRLPKTDSADDIKAVEREIEKVEKEAGIPVGHTKMMAAIESALGVVNVYSIATSSSRLVAIALGAEDYCANLKTTRSLEGSELFFARSSIVVAARAAGLDAIDTVFSDINNEEQLIKETREIKQLGFDGKSIINPRQIAPVHKVFTPEKKEIEKALRIREAIKEAHKKGSGVISLNGKMIDKPVVIRAERCLELAKASGIFLEEL